MLKIVIPEGELFNEATGEFVKVPNVEMQLEHSLISLKKWESKWHKPFLSKEEKTQEELLDYIRCMTVTPNIDPSVYFYIPESELRRIWSYIDDPMTATWFGGEQNEGSIRKKEVITAEIIYYWMIALNIPVEFQKWHLNQLLTLIRVVNIKNAPPKKMKKRDILARNSKLNEARKAKLNSRG